MKMFRGAMLGILLWTVLFAVLCLTSTVSNCGNSSAPMAVNIGIHFLPQRSISALIPEMTLPLKRIILNR